MKILILGAGQVGSSVAYHLSREEANEITVVDTRANVLRKLQDRLDIRTVVGNAAFPEVLLVLALLNKYVLMHVPIVAPCGTLLARLPVTVLLVAQHRQLLLSWT